MEDELMGYVKIIDSASPNPGGPMFSARLRCIWTPGWTCSPRGSLPSSPIGPFFMGPETMPRWLIKIELDIHSSKMFKSSGNLTDLIYTFSGKANLYLSAICTPRIYLSISFNFHRDHTKLRRKIAIWRSVTCSSTQRRQSPRSKDISLMELHNGLRLILWWFTRA